MSRKPESWGAISDELGGAELELVLSILKRAKLAMWAADGPENDYAIRLWTSGAEAVYGFSKEEALGKNYIDLFVNPKERGQAQEDHSRMVENDEDYEWDWAADDIGRDGSVHTMITNCFPVLDEGRGKFLLAEVGVDISKKDAAAQKLRQLQNQSLRKEIAVENVRYMSAVESLHETLGRLTDAGTDGGPGVLRAVAASVRKLVPPDASCRIWLVDRDGNAVLAEGSDDLRGRSIVDEASVARHLVSLGDPHAAHFVDSSNKPVPFEVQHIRGRARALAAIPIVWGINVSGVILVQYAKAQRISDAERQTLTLLGNQAGVALAMADLSDELHRRRQAEASRIRAESVRTFLRLVFHGVGNAAFVMSEDIQKLLAAVDENLIEGKTTAIVHRLEQQSALLNAALENFRQEQDHVHDLRPVRVSDICSGATGDLEYENPSVDVICDVEEGLVARATEFLMAEALGNLVRNAVQSMMEADGGGLLRIHAVTETTEEDQAVTIIVEDSGPGIPEPLRSRIWEPGESTKGDGHGYGLTYAKEAIKLLGGTLDLLTESQLGGAAFAIRLPSARD